MDQLRDRWPGQPRFLAAALGAGLGLGGFTDLPVAAARHGGGAFLVAFVLVLAAVAVPLVGLELGLGVCYQGSIAEGMRKVRKRWEWLGWWSVVLGVLAALPVAALVSWTVLAGCDSLIAALAGRPLPCGSTPDTAQAWLIGLTGEVAHGSPLAAAAALQPSGPLLLALVAIWVAAQQVARRGLDGIARFATVAIPLALALTVVLLAGAAFVDGAGEGLATLLVPRWSALAEPGTWGAAVSAVLRVLPIGLGVFVAYGSYLQRSADATGAATIVVLAAGIAALIAAALIACGCGILAAAAERPTAIPADPTHAPLVAWPAAIAASGLPRLVQGAVALAACACIALPGLGTLVALLAAIATAVDDKFRRGWTSTCRLCAFILFLFGAVLATPSGPALVGELRDAVLPYGIAAAAAAQCVALSWITGSSDDLRRHLNAYSAIPVGAGWRLMVALVAPAAFLGVVAAHVCAAGVPGWQGLVADGLCAAAVAVALSLALLPGRRSFP